jgi:hypothetical protein
MNVSLQRPLHVSLHGRPHSIRAAARADPGRAGPGISILSIVSRSATRLWKEERARRVPEALADRLREMSEVGHARQAGQVNKRFHPQASRDGLVAGHPSGCVELDT